MTLKKGEGIARKRFQWPGNEWRSGAELNGRFVDGSKVGHTYDGPWGWLRLLDNSRFRKRDGGFEAEWKFTVGGKYDVDIRIDTDVYDPNNPFTDTDFYSFPCASEFIDGQRDEQNAAMTSGFEAD